MNKRAQRNASNAKSIESQLAKLHAEATLPECLAKYAELDHTCVLSGDSMLELMRDSTSDVFMFALRVARPEHVIDAPTELAVLRACVGLYSNEAFMGCAGHRLREAANAFGGFVDARAAGELSCVIHSFRFWLARLSYH